VADPAVVRAADDVGPVVTRDEYLLPPVFYADHRARDLPETGTSEHLGDRGRRAVVRMDEAAYRDLYTDADYYTDTATAEQMGLPGLAASARATLRALRKQNPELAGRIDREQEERRRRWLTS
jgi:hypothetical protein